MVRAHNQPLATPRPPGEHIADLLAHRGPVWRPRLNQKQRHALVRWNLRSYDRHRKLESRRRDKLLAANRPGSSARRRPKHGLKGSSPPPSPSPPPPRPPQQPLEYFLGHRVVTPKQRPAPRYRDVEVDWMGRVISGGISDAAAPQPPRAPERPRPATAPPPRRGLPAGGSSDASGPTVPSSVASQATLGPRGSATTPVVHHFATRQFPVGAAVRLLNARSQHCGALGIVAGHRQGRVMITVVGSRRPISAAPGTLEVVARPSAVLRTEGPRPPPTARPTAAGAPLRRPSATEVPRTGGAVEKPRSAAGP
eukprot:TRINITY_DN7901_c0_g1_i2.p1 TRINITY_DN7901_c0_g1~~TRINITY_DN7901_c0_g1_i2.p1  ORF type:complete len:333 (+),score=41.71 TRINITY_DN7901_c0_g1_i2:70-999(+)